MIMTEPSQTPLRHSTGFHRKMGAVMQRRSLVRVVEVLAQDLVHGEHMDFVLFEYCPHGLVASDLSFVVGVLEVFGPDVGPYLFDGLRAGQLLRLVAITPSSECALLWSRHPGAQIREPIVPSVSVHSQRRRFRLRSSTYMKPSTPIHFLVFDVGPRAVNTTVIF